MIRHVASFLAAFIVLVGMFVFIERTFSTTFQQCVAKNSNAPQSSGLGVTVDSYVRCTGEFIDDNGEAITALATIVIAAFTFTLWIATSHQGQLTKEALIADKRAFVFATGINPQWEANTATGNYDWRIRVTWKNSGDTPTRRMRLHTDCELRNSPLPNNFTFVESIPPGTGLLGPGANSMGGAAPLLPSAALSPQDLVDVTAGRKYLYLWGWVRYSDVFPKTSEHITRFCWQIIVVGDPFTFTPGQDAHLPNSLKFAYIHLGQGNCADEECHS